MLLVQKKIFKAFKAKLKDKVDLVIKQFYLFPVLSRLYKRQRRSEVRVFLQNNKIRPRWREYKYLKPRFFSATANLKVK